MTETILFQSLPSSTEPVNTYAQDLPEKIIQRFTGVGISPGFGPLWVNPSVKSASHRMQQGQLAEAEGHEETRQVQDSLSEMAGTTLDTLFPSLSGSTEPADIIQHFTGSGMSPGFDPTWADLSIGGDLGHLYPDLQESLPSAVVVPPNLDQQESESLSSKAISRLDMNSTVIPSRFRSSMSDCGDEQGAKEQKVINQLHAVSQGSHALSQTQERSHKVRLESLSTLFSKQEGSHTALQAKHDALQYEIEEMTRKDQYTSA